MLHRARTALFLAVGLFFLAGCWSVDKIESDPTPYLVSEAGTTRQFFALTVYMKQQILPGTYPIDGGGPIVLFATPAPRKFGLPHQILKLPDWRHIDTLAGFAQQMLPPYPPNTKREETPIRWVIGTKPLVVALGTQKRALEYGGPGIWDGKLELASALAMVREEDLASTATELSVLDQWPEPSHLSHDVNYWDRVTTFVAAHKRIIKLDRPTTLRELMSTRPWEKTRGDSAAAPPLPSAD